MISKFILKEKYADPIN